MLGLLVLNLNVVQGQCLKGMASQQYEQELCALSEMADNFNLFQKAIILAENNCLNAEQVAGLAALFDNDNDRLEFCKRAFDNTVDKQNYYEVYNSFFYFSNVFRLHDLLKEQPESAPAIASKKSGKVESPQKEDVMSGYSLPDPNYYFGPSGCNTPISVDEFEMLLEQLSRYHMK